MKLVALAPLALLAFGSVAQAQDTCIVRRSSAAKLSR